MKVTDLNKQYLYIFVFGLVVNLCAFVLQRWIGFEYVLHDDSYEYIEYAQNFLDSGFELKAFFWLNKLFPFLVYLSLYLSGSVYLITVLNLIIGSFLPIALIRLALAVKIKIGDRSVLILGGVLSLLPYTTHLSVNLLKEVLFILLTVEFLIRVIKKEYLVTLILLILLLWTRNSLAYFMPVAYLAVLLYLIKPTVITTALYGLLAIVVVLNTPILDIFERSAFLSLEGRDFFSNLPLVRVTNGYELVLSFVTSPLKNIFLPNIFTTNNATELMYAMHSTVFQITVFLFFAFVITNKISWSNEMVKLMLFSLICMWFIDVVLPNWGANMRYREAFLLILETMMLATILEIVQRKTYVSAQVKKMRID